MTWLVANEPDEIPATARAANGRIRPPVPWGCALNLLSRRAAITCAAVLFCCPADAAQLYTVADFPQVRKFDAHVHANASDGAFLDIAARDGFEILSINVDYPDFPSLESQAEVAHQLQAASPGRFHFATSFSMQGFGEEKWEAETIRHIDAEIARGAVAVKVWKNIGMVEKDARGQHVMLDDTGFDGLMRHLEDIHVPLIAHQAEPKNCWLPLEAMTTENDRSYFRDHPEYHMFLHPDQPSYETLIAARDRFVGRHRKLAFIGAHLASLEWSVDEIARFLDRYPNATVDLAARMTQVQYQSVRNHPRVRSFFIKYQDRILYGSDLAENPPESDEHSGRSASGPSPFEAEADAFWRSDWMYLATSDVQRIEAIRSDVKGLALPKAVIDKIYYANAMRVFGLPAKAAQSLKSASLSATRISSTRTSHGPYQARSVGRCAAPSNADGGAQNVVDFDIPNTGLWVANSYSAHSLVRAVLSCIASSTKVGRCAICCFSPSTWPSRSQSSFGQVVSAPSPRSRCCSSSNY
jgi:predicted TIM-barrel fold metal-dependent hydrolase